MSNVTITVSGPVGSGKSALCKEIEILCRALGVPCVWEGGEEERNLVGGDSYNELAMYQPCVTLREALAQPDKVMVPREPTEAMVEAAERMEDELPLSDWGKTVHATPAQIYVAMIAAAQGDKP